MSNAPAVHTIHENARAPGPHSSLEHYLAPIRALLDEPTLTELCINAPGVLWVERLSGWAKIEMPTCSYEWCVALAHLVANHTQQRVSDSAPLLSATLPSGERAQFVLPPVMPPGCVSITLRKPSPVLYSLDQLNAQDEQALATLGEDTQGMLFDWFAHTRWLPARHSRHVDLGELSEADEQLLTHTRAHNALAFLREAVRAHKNILLSGATRSGKTTLAKALMLEVSTEERIVTIEDVRELVLRHQPNHVSMVYSQGAQGVAHVSAADLLISAKRMRPDRVFVSELRTPEEAYDYLVSINTGHPGSITSIHANSAPGAFIALAQLIKRSTAGQSMRNAEALALAKTHVDIVVQCARDEGRLRVREIWFNPQP